MKTFALSLAVACATLLSTLPLSAEETWRAGFHIGTNLSRFEGSDGSGAEPSGARRGALSGGLLVERRLSGAFSLQSGVLVLQRVSERGQTLHLGPDGPALHYVMTMRLRYAEIPLLLKATFGDGALRPWVAAGPALDLRLATQEDVRWDTVPDAGNASYGTDDFFRSAVVVFEAAAGAEYRLDGGAALHLGVFWSPATANLLGPAPFSPIPVDTAYERPDDVRVLVGVSLPF